MKFLHAIDAGPWDIDTRLALHLPGMVITTSRFGSALLVASNTGWWHVLQDGRLLDCSQDKRGTDIQDAQRLAADAAMALHIPAQH